MAELIFLVIGLVGAKVLNLAIFEESSFDKTERKLDKRVEKILEKRDQFLEKYPFAVKAVKTTKNLILCPGYTLKGVAWLNLTTESPNLLIAGTSGAGKSKLIKAIICQLIENYTPRQMKLYYLDNKGGIESRAFRYIRHLVERTCSVEESIKVFEKIKNEVEKRNKLIEKYDVTNIVELNEKRKEQLPFIVVFIDELSPYFAMPDKKKQKKAYADFATVSAMCRSAGVHLIFCSQRTTSEILPTYITDNCDFRIGLRTANSQGSQNIIEEPGLELIKRTQKGRGVIKSEVSIPFQTWWIEEDEIKEICAKHKKSELTKKTSKTEGVNAIKVETPKIPAITNQLEKVEDELENAEELEVVEEGYEELEEEGLSPIIF